MVLNEELRHLRRCVELAALALMAGDEPFGSVLVAADGTILGEDHNDVASDDRTRHPEWPSAAAAPAARNTWLIRYDPRQHQVPIRAGENGERTLPHKNIVREVHLLGKWNGTAASFEVPGSSNAILKSAVLVQDGPGGAIMAARKI